MAGKYDWKPSGGVRSVGDVFNLGEWFIPFVTAEDGCRCANWSIQYVNHEADGRARWESLGDRIRFTRPG